MLYGIDEVSPFENALGEIVIKTTYGCEHAIANVDSIAATRRGRYAGGSHIILSSFHITHSESSLRPIPRRRIEASPTGRDCDSLLESSESTVPFESVFLSAASVYQSSMTRTLHCKLAHACNDTRSNFIERHRLRSEITDIDRS